MFPSFIPSFLWDAAYKSFGMQDIQTRNFFEKEYCLKIIEIYVERIKGNIEPCGRKTKH